MNNRSASKIPLKPFDSLFGESGEQVKSIPLEELHTFKNHPFRVIDDEKMEETTESIRQYGVLMPGIARPRAGGGYEIIAGHRRKRGSERAGKTEMPMIVRDYSDDEAAIIMVDSNIQREDLLISEKAKAYRMKFDAMKHQGRCGDKNTLDEIGAAAGESGKTVQRYICLSRLEPELLEMLDNKKLGIVQGVNISYLSAEEQRFIIECLDLQKVKINVDQSERLKAESRAGNLTQDLVHRILESGTKAENKRNKKEVLELNVLTDYFPPEYTPEEMKEVIINLLSEWQKQNTKK